MQIILPIFILIPFIGFLLTILPFVNKESTLSRISFTVIGFQHVLAILFSIYWLYSGQVAINIKEITLYKTKDYEFFIDLYFDHITMVYLLVGSLLTFLITTYSRAYLHRESGYKRFFNSILFFYTGYSIAIFSGNFETFFIGWEVVGISSFLLIAYYRERYLPVRNAFKVFSLYRLADVCLILAMWMSHHLWHHNVTFLEINDLELLHSAESGHLFMVYFISIMFLIAAAVKSAQFPFSSWLPRAMEGPTPSSAIFYGSLSVHIGAFLLLRTFPFWEDQLIIRLLIGSLGLTSSIIATFSAKVQSSVKSQIAYSSAAQIGLIFMEISMGLEILALIHIAGNAFFRTYQLLVSPSIVTYLIREQLYSNRVAKYIVQSSLAKKINNSLYVLSIKEWNMDTYLFRILWNPVKKTGKYLNVFKHKAVIFSLIPLYLGGWFIFEHEELIDEQLIHYFPVVYSFIGLLLVLVAFSERKHIRTSLILIVSNHFWIALAVSFNEHFGLSHVIIYLSGVVVSAILGLTVLNKLKKKEPNIDLNSFQGHIYEHKGKAFLFLLAVLGLAGFPITTTFLGEDLIFSHIHEHQFLLTIFVAISLIVDGLVLIRMYTRIFLGPHSKNYHVRAYRSS